MSLDEEVPRITAMSLAVGDIGVALVKIAQFLALASRVDDLDRIKRYFVTLKDTLDD